MGEFLGFSTRSVKLTVGPATTRCLPAQETFKLAAPFFDARKPWRFTALSSRYLFPLFESCVSVSKQAILMVAELSALAKVANKSSFLTMGEAEFMSILVENVLIKKLPTRISKASLSTFITLCWTKVHATIFTNFIIIPPRSTKSMIKHSWKWNYSIHFRKNFGRTTSARKRERIIRFDVSSCRPGKTLRAFIKTFCCLGHKCLFFRHSFVKGFSVVVNHSFRGRKPTSPVFQTTREARRCVRTRANSSIVIPFKWHFYLLQTRRNAKRCVN